ncbi:MAG: DNA internalization-related competence protein ComEC/Rec2 [Proteobacteria bacterium]|nr:DNA internalization-related competence protein ComEC/Rec2 [Pseudomonadota bacterium]
MHRTELHQGRLIPPGLLPWQYGVLGLAAGILGLCFPVPACCSLILIFLLSRASGLGTSARVVVAACFLAGWGYAVWALPGPVPSPAPWMLERTPAVVLGRVAQVESRPGGVLRVFLAEARYVLDSGEQGPIPGLLLWNWHSPLVRPVVGQDARVRLRVRPVRGYVNEGGWDTAFHWRRQGVFQRGWTHGGQGDPEVSGPAPGVLARWHEAMRRAVVGELESPEEQVRDSSAFWEASGEPAAHGRALLAALVLGDRLLLNEDLYAAVQDAALGHSLALSGLHLGFAAAMGFGLAWLLGRVRPAIYLRCPYLKLGVLLAMPFAGFYLWLGGASPSLVRAALMLATWGLMLWLDRERPLLDGLFVAVALILLASPLSLFDIRLQFSVVAVAGIAILGPPLWRLILKVRLPGERRVPLTGAPAGEGFRAGIGRWASLGIGSILRSALGVLAVSFAATLALLPLSSWYFGQVALSLWTNVLWLPLLGMFVVPAGLMGALLSTLPGLSWLGQGLLVLDARLLDACARGVLALDGAGLLPVLTPMRLLWPQILGLYALVLGALVLWRTRHPAAWAGVALAVGLLLWPVAQRGLMGADDVLRLTLLDVGQGQAVLIEAPGGHRALIDGGGAWSKSFDVGRAVVTPQVAWGRLPRLDLVVLSHPDHDHYRGLLHPLRHCTVRGFAHNGRWPEGEEGDELRWILEERGVPVEVWGAGMRRELAPGVDLEVLHPRDPARYAGNNDGSLVLRLTWHGHGLVLIPGDAEGPALEELLASDADLEADVLLLPHHGARDALHPGLYARCSPRLALAATGFLNHLGFPHPEVLAALGLRGVPVLDTGTCGQVRLTWSESEHGLSLETRLSAVMD